MTPHLNHSGVVEGRALQGTRVQKLAILGEDDLDF
jgi:hypothetical protein